MSLNTTHSTIKSSPVSQSLMKGLGVSVFETTWMYPNIASGVNNKLIPDTNNVDLGNGGLVSSSRLLKTKNMKINRIYLFVIICCFSLANLKAATWYWQSGPVTTLTNWNSTANGGGTTPTNFTGADVWDFDLGASTTLDLSGWTISGSIKNSGPANKVATFTTSSGTFTSQGTTAWFLPGANLVVSGLNVTYPTAGTTIVGLTYSNLTLSHTSGTSTAAAAITVSGTLTTTSGGTFAMGANTLTLGATSVLTNAGTISTDATLTIPIGVTLTNSGTILTTAATPFTDNRASKTYGGTVNLASSNGGQTILTGFTFDNLTLSNSSSTNTLAASAAITVSGTLTITNVNMYLILNGGALTVNTFAGNGALTGSSTSVVIYNGTSSTMLMNQTNDLSSNRLKYLKLNSGASLTLGNKLVVYGGSGNSGGDIELIRTPSASTLTTAGFLTLKHIGGSSGHPIIGGLASISGSVSVEDYFESGSRTYRQAGSVLSGGLPVNQITDDFDLYATNPGVTDANGFLLSTAGVTNPSLLIYNEASSPKWVPIVMSNPVSTLAAGKGFAFFMRPAGSGASGNYNDQYFDYSGNINNSDLTLGSILTYSGTSGISSTNGYNLLANPYCSYLDLNQFFLDNTHLDPVIYKLNKFNRGHESYGLKSGVSLGLGAKWNKTSNVGLDLDAYIDPGDAFFVKLKTTSGGAAPSSTSVVFKLAQVATSISTKIGGIGQNKMEIDSNSYSALTVTMKFMNDSINMDAVKLVNSSVGGNEVVNTSLWDIYDMRSTCNELSLVSVNNDMLAVKTLNSNKNWIVPMNVATCSKGKCYFDFNIDYNKPGMEATFELYDKYLKKNFTIVSGSKYEFEVSDIPQSFGADRFYINMNNSALGARYDNNLNSFELYPNPVAVSGKIYIKLNCNEPGEIEIRNVVGQTLSKKELVANSGQLQLDLESYNFLPGTYFISCKQKSGTATKRVTLF